MHPPLRFIPLLLLLAACTAAAPATQPALGIGASFHGIDLMPASSLWRRDISKDPVAPDSKTLIASIGPGKPLHPDFGAGSDGVSIGIPYVIVDGNQPRVPVRFTEYADQSDPGPYPIPADTPIEGSPKSDGDRHVIVFDRDHRLLYELWRAFPERANSWRAANGAVFDLTTNTARPTGWTSADAAGLPILPGLSRYDEVAEVGQINHALRFTVQHTRRQFIAPATHFASRSDDKQLPPMGLRIRLRADYDVSRFPPQAKVIAIALQKYGMILADNGSDWFISGAPDPRWNDDDLNTLKQIRGRDLEVVTIP